MWSFDGQLLARFYEITLLINSFSSGKLIPIEGVRHGLPGGMLATASSRSAQEHPMVGNDSERLAAPKDNSNETFSGVESFKPTSGHASAHFEKINLSEDCGDYFRTDLQNKNMISHYEEVNEVNEEEVSFFEDYIKKDSGE